jgi:hypothetical protein
LEIEHQDEETGSGGTIMAGITAAFDEHEVPTLYTLESSDTTSATRWVMELLDRETIGA